MKTKQLLIALSLAFAFTAHATTYYVRSTGGADRNNGLTSGTAFLTLTKVFSGTPVLANGDVIDISGIFTYAVSKTITSSITIQGTDKTRAVINGISVDDNSNKNCLNFGSQSATTGLPTSTPTIIIENVTFQNFDNIYATAVTYNGGTSGVLNVYPGTTLTCRNVNFLNNQSYTGGAINASGGALTLEDCYFKNNSAKISPMFSPATYYADGGAINIAVTTNMVGGATPIINTNSISVVINRCLFEANNAVRYGSAVRFQDNSTGATNSLLIQNSTFTGNSTTSTLGAKHGATIYIEGNAANADIKLINNTIAYNSSIVNLPGANVGVTSTFIADKVTLINNILFSNYNSETTPNSISIKSTNLLKESRNNITDQDSSLFDFTAKTTTGKASGNENSVTSGQLLLATSLADNGGATKTLAVTAGSTAINAGYATGVPTVDQRNIQRKGTDVGAYENATTQTVK